MGGDAGPAGEPGLTSLDAPLIRALRRVGADSCLLFLVPPGEQVLQLATLSGVTPEVVKPWLRVPLSAPTPLTDSIRERRMIWLDSQRGLVRDYPQVALTLPYLFMMAAVPLTDDDADWGALLLLWSASHPLQLSAGERRRIDEAARGLTTLLREAADRGRPILPGPEPRVITPATSHLVSTPEAAAAAEFTERLPEGCCALDLQGRITFLNTNAANLLGGAKSQLLGKPPWETLAWLNDPVYEDRYRAALISRLPTSFTARSPDGRWLAFDLYPDSQGISVRITPTKVTEPSEEAPESSPSARSLPTRPGALYQLMHLAATLTEAVGVQDVVDLVADQIMPAFDAQGLLLFELESGRLRNIGSRGYTPAALEHLTAASFRSPTTTPERMLSSGRPLFFESPEEMRRQYPGILELNDKAAWVFLPLIVSGRPIGCCLLSYDRPHEFAPEERSILTSLAGLIGQALARARLYDTKHDLAHGLQASLLPAVLPTVPGLEVAARYLPATRGMDIGGDFYDLIHLDDATTAAVIGDVQGHNVTAAALMGQVRTAVHAHATAGAGPGDVLTHTNRLLTDLSPGLFTSCLYAHIDLKNEQLCLASAGHLPPLLRHPDGHTEVLWTSPGLLLGIEPDAEYPTTELPLPSRSVLALYTDGLVESPGADLDQSIKEFADVLARAGEESMDSLAASLLRHRRRFTTLDDDIALLLLSPRP